MALKSKLWSDQQQNSKEMLLSCDLTMRMYEKETQQGMDCCQKVIYSIKRGTNTPCEM